MNDKLVKTGFWMPKSYSERAQAIAKSRGISMRTLLVEAIGVGLDHFEAKTTTTISSAPVQVDVEPELVSMPTSDFLANLAEIARYSVSPTPQTTKQPPRHKPDKNKNSTWRFR